MSCAQMCTELPPEVKNEDVRKRARVNLSRQQTFPEGLQSGSKLMIHTSKESFSCIQDCSTAPVGSDGSKKDKRFSSAVRMHRHPVCASDVTSSQQNTSQYVASISNLAQSACNAPPSDQSPARRQFTGNKSMVSASLDSTDIHLSHTKHTVCNSPAAGS